MSEYGDYTHYDTLEVDEDASQDIIESAYQYLCHKWHPNKHPEQRADAERRLAGLSRAYRVISKPEKRAEYDAWLLKQRGGDAPKKSNADADAAGTVSTIQSKGHPVGASAIAEAQFSDVSQSEPPSPKFGANDFANVVHSNDSQSLPEGYEYASFWARAGALIVDGVVVLLMVIVLGGLLAGSGIFAADPVWHVIIQLAVAIRLYVDGWAGEDMATYGKKVFGLEIRTEKFERISYGVAFARMITWTMGTMLLGVTYLTQPFTKKRQCLHDMAVSTVVIKRLDARASRGTIIATWFLVMVPIVGILAAISLPAYQAYLAKAKVAAAHAELMVAANAVTENEYRGGDVPSNLAEVGYVSSAPSGDWSGPAINSDTDTFFIHVDSTSGNYLISRGRLAVVPYTDDSDRLLWECYAYDLDASVVPQGCELWEDTD